MGFVIKSSRVSWEIFFPSIIFWKSLGRIGFISNCLVEFISEAI